MRYLAMVCGVLALSFGIVSSVSAFDLPEQIGNLLMSGFEENGTRICMERTGQTVIVYRFHNTAENLQVVIFELSDGMNLAFFGTSSEYPSHFFKKQSGVETTWEEITEEEFSVVTSNHPLRSCSGWTNTDNQ